MCSEKGLIIVSKRYLPGQGNVVFIKMKVLAP